MKTFPADRFLTAYSMALRLRGRIENLPNVRSVPPTPGHEGFSEIQEHIEELMIELMPLGLNHAGRSATELALLWNDGRSTYGQIESEIKVLERSLVHELKDRTIFIVDAEKRRYLEPIAPPFSADVISSFPSTQAELLDAGRCLALGNPTGCVMHLMRIAELGLTSVAREFNITFDHASWNFAIENIQKAAKAISPTSHGPTWKDERHFYSEVATQFLWMKDAWRNYAMHIRARYDEAEAERVFASVGNLMVILAKRLKEVT